MALRRSRVRFPSAPPLSLNTKSMISFSDAIKLGFMRYSDFRGRSTPAEFWWWLLFSVPVLLVFIVIDISIGIYTGLLSGLFGLAALVPLLALGARRLHDINRTGWWQLMWLGFFLIIPAIILFVWAIKQGDASSNRYGLDPRQSPKY